MPASNAMSEHSFSTLRRVKTYLRSTMRQDRLNYLMILHVHKERTDALDLKEVANEFVGLNIDIAYSVNFYFSLLCPSCVYWSAVLCPLWKDIIASKTYQNPSLRTKIQKFSWGSMPPHPPTNCTLHMILKVNWPDHSKLASSGPVTDATENVQINNSLKPVMG